MNSHLAWGSSQIVFGLFIISLSRGWISSGHRVIDATVRKRLTWVGLLMIIVGLGEILLEGGNRGHI